MLIVIFNLRKRTLFYYIIIIILNGFIATTIIYLLRYYCVKQLFFFNFDNLNSKPSFVIFYSKRVDRTMSVIFWINLLRHKLKCLPNFVTSKRGMTSTLIKHFYRVKLMLFREINLMKKDF